MLPVFAATVFHLTLALGFLPQAFAQVAEDVYESPTRESEQEELIEKTAGQAEKLLTGATGAKITFADILADPDNVELNFLYAQQQVKSGDLKGASATLERILLINPELAQIRLFYAIVLFRLDNVDEAEREFQNIAALDIPGDIRSQVEAYLDRISQRRQKTRFAASLSAGWHYDTNKDSAASSKSQLVSGSRTGARGPNDDAGWQTIAGVSVAHDLGFQDRHELIASASLYLDEQNEIDTQDIQSFSFSAGGIYRTRYLDFTPTATFSQLRLDHETYLRSWSYKLRTDHEINPLTNVYFEGQFGYQQFNPVNTSQVASDRSGQYFELAAGGSYVINPAHRLSLKGLFKNTRAKKKYNHYQRHQLSATHTWILGGGQFLLTAGTIGLDLYGRPDTFVSPMTRRDETYRLRITYGAPLGFLSSLVTDTPLPDAINDVVFTVAGEQYRQLSNLTSYTYSNSKFQTMLSKRWRF